MDVQNFPNGGIFIPSRVAGSKWLLVALHGSNGSASNFEGIEEIFDIPELNYLFLNGPIPSFANFRWYSDPLTRRDCVPYLEKIFQTIEREGYPPEKTFLMGFSQGAALTFEFGAQYANLFCGYIALSGRIESLPALLNYANPLIVSRGRWLVTHGIRDFNLAVGVIRDQVEQLRQAGFKIEYREYDKIHEFDGEKELPEVREWIRDAMRD